MMIGPLLPGGDLGISFALFELPNSLKPEPWPLRLLIRHFIWKRGDATSNEGLRSCFLFPKALTDTDQFYPQSSSSFSTPLPQWKTDSAGGGARKPRNSPKATRNGRLSTLSWVRNHSPRKRRICAREATSCPSVTMLQKLQDSSGFWASLLLRQFSLLLMRTFPWVSTSSNSGWNSLKLNTNNIVENISKMKSETVAHKNRHRYVHIIEFPLIFT